MGDLSVFFYISKKKIMFKNHSIKSNHRVQRKNKVDTHGPPVFVPDIALLV
jgi:hypothetical protein